MPITYSIIYVCGVLVASIAQIILKLSTRKQYDSIIGEYLNPYVIIGYGMFFASTIINIFALSKIDLSLGAALEALGYIFVAVLSFFILKETSTLKQIVGYVCIIIGVIFFAI